MISFNNIGHIGRLGNQMFQYASLRGIASFHDYWYSIPNHISELYGCFKIPRTIDNYNQDIFTTEVLTYDKNFFFNCPDDVDLVGFFQSEKYFKHIENQIRKDFLFHGIVELLAEYYIRDRYLPKEYISMHVRRGDYLSDSGFHCLELDYYYEAIELMPDLPLIIFSDDPEWCSKTFPSHHVVYENSSSVDMCLMTKTKYHIIANSSFSWWGSWLANSEKTIAPKKWFSGKFASQETEDLYLPNWIII